MRTSGREHWLQASEIIVLAVKPQQMREAAASIKPHLKRPLVLSIAAGVRAQHDSDVARHQQDRARNAQHASADSRRHHCGNLRCPTSAQPNRGRADRILSAVGAVIWLDDEAMLDAVTALSGSGPAYVFYFIEAMQKVALEMGFNEAQARALTLHTFAGSAAARNAIARVRGGVARRR